MGQARFRRQKFCVRQFLLKKLVPVEPIEVDAKLLVADVHQRRQDRLDRHPDVADPLKLLHKLEILKQQKWDKAATKTQNAKTKEAGNQKLRTVRKSKVKRRSRLQSQDNQRRPLGRSESPRRERDPSRDRRKTTTPARSSSRFETRPIK